MVCAFVYCMRVRMCVFCHAQHGTHKAPVRRLMRLCSAAVCMCVWCAVFVPCVEHRIAELVMLLL